MDSRSRRTLILGLLLAALPHAIQGQEREGELSLMTFNIRYGTAEDGPNAWETRRALVDRIIRDEDPAVLAIQEGLLFQLEELALERRGYRKLGQHRDGGLDGEFSGLYVQEDRVAVQNWGEIWLSPTPDSVASTGWDAALPRMAVWADLRVFDTGESLRVYGTHFDHQGETARLESARLLADHAEAGPPAVIMGDLNADEDSGPLKLLVERGYRSAFTTLHPRSELGTFNGFRDPGGGGRIDHILLGPDLEVRKAAILAATGEDGWPSDHFPVTATITFRHGPSLP